jgi:hypothetical protein
MVFPVGKWQPPESPTPGYVAATQLTASAYRHPVLKSPIILVREAGHEPYQDSGAGFVPLDLVRKSWQPNLPTPDTVKQPSSDGHTKMLAVGSIPTVAEKANASGPGRRIPGTHRPSWTPPAPPLRSSTGATIHPGTRKGGSLLAWAIAGILIGLILIGCGLGVNNLLGGGL